jgi:hypothetical protein
VAFEPEQDPELEFNGVDLGDGAERSYHHGCREIQGIRCQFIRVGRRHVAEKLELSVRVAMCIAEETSQHYQENTNGTSRILASGGSWMLVSSR